MNCFSCQKQLTKRSQKKFCSNLCQNDHEYTIYVQEWLKGSVSGGRGIVAKNMTGHILRYLKDKFGESCSSCNWKTINPITQKVPLEIDHIDGDSENNSPDNLRVLCPNCHSLTTSYKNLNYGKGREWRRKKYLKIT